MYLYFGTERYIGQPVYSGESRSLLPLSNTRLSAGGKSDKPPAKEANRGLLLSGLLKTAYVQNFDTYFSRIMARGRRGG